MLLQHQRVGFRTARPSIEVEKVLARRQGWPYKKPFVCHRCGNCCRGDGFVDLSQDDIARAAAYLELSEAEFLARYAVQQGDSWILRDQEDAAQSCIFLFEDDKGLAGCRIHGAKPTQCAGFPFEWRPRDAADFCEGIRALEGLPPARRRTMSKPAGKKNDQGADNT
jgi:Fe-S-cluster containining protein